LFIDGLWRCVVIDDYFPLHGGRPIFAKDHSEEIWVMLIEKAYAKTFKNYQAIESGLTGIALNALTGAPFEYLNKDSKSSIDVETAWNFLTQNFSMQHIMTGST
jgi:calpain-15